MFRIEQDQDHVTIVLDRPEARNAIPLEGWGQLTELVAQVGASSARLLVIKGSGGAFCAGADLGDFARLSEDEAARTRFREDMRRAFDSLLALQFPVLAWIEGPCYGAGVALAMACDLRVAAISASFAITPAKMGISYPQQDVHRLVELVGVGQAARLLFSAASIDAPEAHRIGLVDLVSEDSASTIGAIARNDIESLKVLKRAIRRAAEGGRHDEALDRRFDELIADKRLADRLAAFRRK